MEWAKIFSSESHEIYKRKMLIQVEVKLRSLHYASEFPFFTMVKRPKIMPVERVAGVGEVNDGATGEGQHPAVENGSKNSFCLVAILYWIDTFTKADSIGGPIVLCANVDTIVRGLEDSVKRMEKVNRLSTRLIHFTKQMIEAPLLWISLCDDVEVFGEEWCGLLHSCRSVYRFHPLKQVPPLLAESDLSSFLRAFVCSSQIQLRVCKILAPWVPCGNWLTC